MRLFLVLFIGLACLAASALAEPKCPPLPAGYCSEIKCEFPYNYSKKQCLNSGIGGDYEYLPHGRHCGCCPECIHTGTDP